MPSNRVSSTNLGLKPILRRWSSQPGPQPERAAATTTTATAAGTADTADTADALPSIRRQTTQERLDAILETARERADNMNSHGTPSIRTLSRHQSPRRDQDGAPDETTSIVTGQVQRDYQSTHSSVSWRRRNHNDAQPSEIDGQEDGDNDRNKTKKHWLKEYFSGIWSIELENKGSVARDHLALERTFLAWLRTSLAFASIGIAITQLFRLNTSLADTDTTNTADTTDDAHFLQLRHIGKPLGATFLGISILVLFLGYNRYLQSQQWVMRGKFPASRGTILLVTLIAFLLMLASLVIVVTFQPQQI